MLLTLLTCLSVLLVPLLAASPAAAQTCDRSGCGFAQCATPIRPVPQTVWGGGELQPVDSDPLPVGRDSSSFNEFAGGQYALTNWFMGIDTANGYLMVAQAYGLQVWDTHADPANPTLTGSITWNHFPMWNNTAEIKWPIQSVAVPAGVDSMAVVSGMGGIGAAIMDLTDKTHPRITYQASGADGAQVYAATIGGSNYAFLAASPGQFNGGLFAFNMTRSMQASGCSETVGSPGNCPGVFVGRIGTRSPQYVHGVDHFVAMSSGSGRGVDIYDVANPAMPQLKVTGLTDRSVYGLAMWQQNGSYYLAERGDNGALGIFDVSCISTSCNGFPGPLSFNPTPPTVQITELATANFFLSFSREGATPFLYLGSDDRCGLPSQQREWLLDVSNPAAPHDITPAPGLYNGVVTGYWGWYYRANPTGFNLVMPRAGKFSGDYFYRAGMAIMDVHKHSAASAPTASFTFSPAQIYPGTPVTFTDTSTGAPTSWAWTFQGGTPLPPSSTASQSPVVTFSAPGGKAVTLTSRNGIGTSALASQSVTVLNPAPQIGGLSVTPANPLQCQPVTLTGQNVTGAPPLVYSWAITAGIQPAPGGTSAANPFVWDTKANGVPAGSYTARLTVSGTGSPATLSTPIVLGALPPLPQPGFSASNDPFTSATVQFHVNAAGATEWNWDFGDGNGFTGWTTDPVAGPNPSHSYTTIGSKTVKVQVRNCINTSGVTSGALTIDVLQVTPLVASFSAQDCLFGFCSFPVNTAVKFTDLSQGAQIWDYDWDGSGQFADSGHNAPVTTHTYTALGSFLPKLRVHRGSEQTTATLSQPISITSATPPPPPSIQISGPSSGQPAQSLTFIASASNCTPTSSWSWSVGDGAISGGTTGSSITVSWATSGSRQVVATNGGCPGIQGSAFVNISTGTVTGGGPLVASYTFAPTSPRAGDTVTFDSTPSSGGATGFAWNFGDGTTGSGAVVTHAFPTAGSYVVKLDLSKQGSGSGCLFGTCVAEATQTVTVAPVVATGPPPLNPDFTANAQCEAQFGFNQCHVSTGQTVTLTGIDPNVTSWSWDFADGTTGSGSPVTHSWTQAGNYAAKLTVSAPGRPDAVQSRTFIVAGPQVPPPTPAVKSVVLPWVAATRGVLVQSTDLYFFNPSTNPLTLDIQFLKRGLPENPPPTVTQAIPAGSTLYLPDVLRQQFNKENVAGFISAVVKDGDMEPILTGFNTIFRPDGGQFGQAIEGVSTSRDSSSDPSAPAAPSQAHYLIGLNDNADQQTQFGVSNPTPSDATYHLSFLDRQGKLLSQSNGSFTVSAFGQRQFQVEQIRSLFGVSNADDYRIEVDSTSTVVPYASKLRIATSDPAFITSGNTAAPILYLLGAYSTTGSWQSDIVLTNTSNQPVTTTMTFTRIGANSLPSTPASVTLQPGETSRLGNAIADKFSLSNAVGVIALDSSGTAGTIFPIALGETYNNADPSHKYGQLMPAFSIADAAKTGSSDFLVGLRQDSQNKTVFWLFNPSPDYGSYDIIYLGLDGTVLGKIQNVNLAPGRVRQFNSPQHRIPAAGVQNGFTVQILVHSGSLLSAAQVVNVTTESPAYIRGVAR